MNPIHILFRVMGHLEEFEQSHFPCSYTEAFNTVSSAIDSVWSTDWAIDYIGKSDVPSLVETDLLDSLSFDNGI